MSTADLASLIKPVSMAGDQLLPVLPALASLLPGGGLRRGSLVVVAGSASSSLALALAAGASAAGSWCAAAGRPELGMVAAAELGIVLERFASVPTPAPAAGKGPGGWAWVVAALVDAFEVVVAWPPSRASVRADDARRLVVRARERGTVLVVAGEPGAPNPGAPRSHGWPEAPDVRLVVTRSQWHGLGEGHGRLRARQVEVATGGRGSAARERVVSLWLPGPEGEVAVSPGLTEAPAVSAAG